MHAKQLIIQLIQQDMKHQQLVEAICLAGFETHIHYLNIMHIVANLMKLNQKKEDRWMEIYMNCLGETKHYTITPMGDNLLPLAEECFMLLSYYSLSGKGKK